MTKKKESFLLLQIGNKRSIILSVDDDKVSPLIIDNKELYGKKTDGIHILF